MQYAPGDQVLIILDALERRDRPKLDRPTSGPYTITNVHTNETITINRGRYTEKINIRHVKPYFT